MSLIYLGILLAAILCMILVDRRFALFFWRDARRATIVLVVGLVFFLLWDLLGISLGIFFRGENAIATGVMLGPELPLEEPVFLIFLCYLTMVVIFGAERLFTRRGRAVR